MHTLTRDYSKVWTVDDYLSLGELSTPCQLLNGELIISPAPNLNHQQTSRKLSKILDRFIQEEELLYAPIDVYLDSRNVFQPDLLGITQERKSFLSERGIEGPPDLILEIISPSNSYMDRYEKKVAYQQFGVTEYWIVDPANKTLEIYNGSAWDKPWLYLANEGAVKSTILPTLTFDLKEIF